MSRVKREEAVAQGEALPSWEKFGADEEWRLIRNLRVAHTVQVREPLVLISQAPRSGGTLASRLFDGHPECHTHPHELHIGYPSSQEWPTLDLDRPESWFEILYESRVTRHLPKGYRKAGWWHGRERATLPFCFSPTLQKSIFDECIASSRPESRRQVFDCYFTAYFNAWLDNHNLYTGPKKVVTGFTPGLAVKEASVEGFFAVYPDGFLITVVRDPCGWYESARGFGTRYGDFERALSDWRQSAEASIGAAERYGDRVILLTYEQLVLSTESVMRRVCERIGLTMSPVMLTPTFNGIPIRANTSGTDPRYGVLRERAHAARVSLDAETIARIEELNGDLYARAEQLAEMPTDALHHVRGHDS